MQVEKTHRERRSSSHLCCAWTMYSPWPWELAAGQVGGQDVWGSLSGSKGALDRHATHSHSRSPFDPHLVEASSRWIDTTYFSHCVFFFGVLTLTLLVLRFLRFFFLNVLFFCKCPMVVKLFIIFSNNPYIKHFLLLICFPFRACFGYQSINWKWTKEIESV